MKVKTEGGLISETKKGLKTVRIVGKCPICNKVKYLCVNDICETCNNDSCDKCDRTYPHRHMGNNIEYWD